MADRSTVFERVLIGKETTPGTAVSPSRALSSMSFSPSYQVDVQTFKPKGYKFNTVAVLNREWTEGGIEGMAAYDELPYLLASLIKDVSPTTPGGATNARLWTFSATTSDSDTPATYTVETGSSIRSMKCPYVLVTEGGFAYSNSEGVQVSGAFIGQMTTDDKTRYIKVTSASGGTFTITVGAQTTGAIAYNAATAAVLAALEALSNVAPGDVTVGGAVGNYVVLFTDTGVFGNTAVPVVSVNGASLTGSGAAVAVTRIAPGYTESDLVPVARPQTQFTIADAAADLGSSDTVLTRLLSANWNLSGRWGPIWTINSDVRSWAAALETDPEGTLEWTVGADDQGMDFLNTLRKGDTIFFRAASVGPLIEAGYNYEFTVDTAVKITEIGELSDEDGLVAIPYTGTFVHDATWGKAFQITVQNALTAL